MIAADSEAEAVDERERVTRARVGSFLGRGRRFSETELDHLSASPEGQQVAAMMRYTAAGAPESVAEYLADFTVHADADELVVVLAGSTLQSRLRSLDLLADVSGIGSHEP